MVIISKKIKIVCGNCGFINELDLDNLIMPTVPKLIRVQCEDCSFINELTPDALSILIFGDSKKEKKEKKSDGTKCLVYKGLPISHMPRGMSIDPGSGVITYSDNNGHDYYTRSQYIKKYGIDPALFVKPRTKFHVASKEGE
mgnify:CR=1 FL=1